MKTHAGVSGRVAFSGSKSSLNCGVYVLFRPAVLHTSGGRTDANVTLFMPAEAEGSRGSLPCDADAAEVVCSACSVSELCLRHQVCPSLRVDATCCPHSSKPP